MKSKIFFCTIIIVLFSCAAWAQEVCSIRYTYDKNGGRVKREYKCDDPNGTLPPWANPDGVIRNVYPIPTTGVFHVDFSSPLSNAYLYVVDMNGTMVTDYTITQQTTTVTLNISPFAAGTYILTGIFSNSMESYPITKL